MGALDDDRSPRGLFGGDGEKEKPAFGFLVEMPGMHQIWSRAELVTQ